MFGNGAEGVSVFGKLIKHSNHTPLLVEFEDAISMASQNQILDDLLRNPGYSGGALARNIVSANAASLRILDVEDRRLGAAMFVFVCFRLFIIILLLLGLRLELRIPAHEAVVGADGWD